MPSNAELHAQRAARAADLAWRAAGIGALGCACLSSLAHRKLLELHGNGPASAYEAALALLSFILASLGMLLLLHGRNLFRDIKVKPEGELRDTKRGALILPMDGRHRMASLLAARAILRTRAAPTDRHSSAAGAD